MTSEDLKKLEKPPWAQEIATEMGIESAPVKTNSLKLWATGKGNASKDAMKKVAAQALGRPPIEDNEADSVLVGLWAHNTFV